MIGKVDDHGRALLDVRISGKSYGDYSTVTTWVDTAFDGHLVFSISLIKELELEYLAETEAILADGSRTALDTYVCFIEWFGERRALQVVANEGRFPLLGIGKLENRILNVDYSIRTLSLV
jgi:predicted aspartyl protease